MGNKATQRPTEIKTLKWVKKDKFRKVEKEKFDKWLAKRPLGE